MTQPIVGGFDVDPLEALSPPAQAGGCCGSPVTTTAAPAAETTGGCCGSAPASTAADSAPSAGCCG